MLPIPSASRIPGGYLAVSTTYIVVLTYKSKLTTIDYKNSVVFSGHLQVMCRGFLHWFLLFTLTTRFYVQLFHFNTAIIKSVIPKTLFIMDSIFLSLHKIVEKMWWPVSYELAINVKTVSGIRNWCLELQSMKVYFKAFTYCSLLPQ